MNRLHNWGVGIPSTGWMDMVLLGELQSCGGDMIGETVQNMSFFGCVVLGCWKWGAKNLDKI